MYLFYNLEQIKSFSVFSGFDFSGFSPFQDICLLLGANIFYLLFLSFVFTIIYKLINRVLNCIF